MDYPLFELLISEDESNPLEVSYVALVDKPAIERNFQAFNDHVKLDFTIDIERRIISGPAMLADVPIFRLSDGDLPDHLVVFRPPTIFNIVKKILAKGLQNNVNMMHDPNQILDGMVMFESFISDKSRGIMPMKGHEYANDGSWFISYFIENVDALKRIQSGELKGFSVEGMFKYKKEQTADEQAFSKINEILNGIKPD
jgi:hypothetical protein